MNLTKKIELSKTERTILESAIRDIKDFPKEGIIFKDITTLLNDKEAYGVLMNHLYQRYKEYNLDFVAGIDARGFIFRSGTCTDAWCRFCSYSQTR